MQRISLLLFVISLLIGNLPGQESPQFSRFFLDKTLRIDFFHLGDAATEEVILDRIYEIPEWAGNLKHLLDPFNNGKYCVKVYDPASNQLIYSRGFSSIFGEYQTTQPARKGVKRVFHESVLIPYPKNDILLRLEARDRMNLFQPIFLTRINPDTNAIIRESPDSRVQIRPLQQKGDPHEKVDVAFIAEGYTVSEKEQFEKDARAFRDVLFSVEPFKSHRSEFNIYAVFYPSAESGVDEPRRGSFKNTLINASFNALDLDRYLLTEDNRTMRNVASGVPYDALVILVNTERYGGGGIYNHYAICTARNRWSENVFLHEFGHSFAGLADEYYTSDVAYSEFYPPGTEPTEPNITAYLSPSFLKWEKFISSGIDIPTDWNKAQYDSLNLQISQISREKRERIAKLKEANSPDSLIDSVAKRFQNKLDSLQNQRKEFLANHPLKDKVGLFEGAGYASNGLYRPMLSCMMFSNDKKEFCRVCEEAILRMIRFYSE
ncbi:MAG: hypothetical protein Kow0042_02500 [Calditrichia bacterium]